MEVVETSNEQFKAVLTMDGVVGGEPSYMLPFEPILPQTSTPPAATTTNLTKTAAPPTEGSKYEDGDRSYLFKCSEGSWEYYKVYDDEDLASDCLFVLVSATLVYTWVGEEFASGNGFAGERGGEDDSSVVSGAKVSEFLVGVGFAEGFDKCKAKLSMALEDGTVQLNTAGEESDDWWDAFESGY